jgi:hypothetical protein
VLIAELKIMGKVYSIACDSGYIPEYGSDGQVIQKPENDTGTIDWMAKERTDDRGHTLEYVELVKELGFLEEKRGRKFRYSEEEFREVLAAMFPMVPIVTITEKVTR